ncbi:putative WRKY transcription factor 19, partial [Drosera capensis]
MKSLSRPNQLCCCWFPFSIRHSHSPSPNLILSILSLLRRRGLSPESVAVAGSRSGCAVFDFGAVSNSSKKADVQSKAGAAIANQSDDGCRLVLGLGPTPTAYCEAKQSRGCHIPAIPGLSSHGDSLLKLGLSGVNGAFPGSLNSSASTHIDLELHQPPGETAAEGGNLLVPILDEGSSTAKQSGGYMPSLLLAPRNNCASKAAVQMPDVLGQSAKSGHGPSQLYSEPSDNSYSFGAASEPSTTLGSSDHRAPNAKQCKVIGCTKGARGSTGLCIGHGGGQRCQKPGCSKGAESRTAYCKAHGGGKRCQHLGCTKSAEGKTDYCIAHGGGRRCGHPSGCNKAARGKTGLCIRHGGGKRCTVDGCTRSAEGQAALCISHGGGRRCQFEGCSKGAQGSTTFCKAHGGGKRCIFAGCSKGAEGSTPLCKGHGGGKRCLFDGGGICPKSVHGGTNFCVAHGGGKRCSIAGCTKSARGRTDCCVRHGGGKRCKVENCGKSAQGSTDFCKAHGGGKRCCWGDGKCDKFARGKSGLCAAHCSLVQGKESKKG